MIHNQISTCLLSNEIWEHGWVVNLQLPNRLIVKWNMFPIDAENQLFCCLHDDDFYQTQQLALKLLNLLQLARNCKNIINALSPQTIYSRNEKVIFWYAILFSCVLFFTNVHSSVLCFVSLVVDPLSFRTPYIKLLLFLFSCSPTC